MQRHPNSPHAQAIPQRLPKITLEPVESSWSEFPEGRHSAVLLLFLPGPEAKSTEDLPFHILFTKRSFRVKTHKGQIGLPGGRAEPDDTGPVDTALREAEEEIALARDSVTILGRLQTLRGLDRSMIVPIVGYADLNQQQLRPNEEVHSIFSVPWSVFEHGRERMIRFNLFGKSRQTYYFLYRDYRIWGLTAAMLVSARLHSYT